jgi:ribonuclease HI
MIVSNKHVVMATHPMAPNYASTSRKRSQHLALSDKRDSLTLCNMLVVEPYPWSEMTRPCAICTAKANVAQSPEPEDKSHVDTKIFTINTDASFSARFKRAAWAYYIKGPSYLARASAVFDQTIPSSHVAELLAFEKAIRRVDEKVKEMEWDPKMCRIFLNTDSMWVIDSLAGRVKNSKNLPIVKAIQHEFKDYIVDARHVKAHLHTKTPRHFVNDWCDKAAKLALRTELQIL